MRVLAFPQTSKSRKGTSFKPRRRSSRLRYRLLSPLEGGLGRVVHGLLMTIGVVLLSLGVARAATMGFDRGTIALLLFGAASFMVTPWMSRAELGLHRWQRYERAPLSSNVGTYRAPRIRSRPKIDEAVMLATALSAPRELIPRIREYVTPQTRALLVRTELTIGPLPTGQGDVYFPVHVSRKGRLLDDLQVRDSSGASVPIIPYAEGVAFVLGAIRILIKEGTDLDGKQYRLKYEDRVYRLISQRSPRTSREELELGNVIAEMRRDMGDTAYSDTILYMVDLLTTNYCQFAALRANSVELQSTLTVEYRRINDFHRSRAFSAGSALARARALLGVRPATYEVNIMNASRCASYHLEFMGPKGTYLARQELVGLRQMPNQADESPKFTQVDFTEKLHARYHRRRRRRGQRYAHLYVRGATKALRRDRMHIVVSFFERPPGSVGEAAVSSFSSTLLILAAGRALSSSHGQLRGDIMALLLALPVAASSWIGLKREESAVGGVMSARLGSLVTFVVSLTAAISVLGSIGWPKSWDPQIALLGAAGAWAVMLGISCITSFLLAISWWRRSSAYSAMLARGETASEYD